jgi:MerR family transcriptional regulator/heat shock protein HspR
MPVDRSRNEEGALPQDEFLLISVAARHLGMHPQTLRKYERLGLVRPTRTLGSMRVYSRDELERLRIIKHLVDEAGINLAGVQRLLAVVDVVQRIRPIASGSDWSRTSVRRLTQELDRLSAMLGL